MSDYSQISVPRLARLEKGTQGYGFNLHGDKNSPGQTISAVDKESPADLGGLREGDRLIEVNNSNVEGMSHGDVVKKIKESSTETTLLVCDRDTLAYLKENNRDCTQDMANLITVYVKPEAEPEHVLVNGDAKPNFVAQKIEESAPVAVEESAPPPALVSREETEPVPVIAPIAPEEPSGPTLDEAEAVKEIKRVVDEEEETPVVVPVVESEPPKPEEPSVPTATAPKADEPVKPKDGDLHLDMQSARPSKNARKSVKQSGEGWSNKVSILNSM